MTNSTNHTVSQWLKENKNACKYCELTIADSDNHIILDDRIGYLPARSKEYNNAWKSQCKGKTIQSVTKTAKGILIKIA